MRPGKLLFVFFIIWQNNTFSQVKTKSFIAAVSVAPSIGKSIRKNINLDGINEINVPFVKRYNNPLISLSFSYLYPLNKTFKLGISGRIGGIPNEEFNYSTTQYQNVGIISHTLGLLSILWQNQKLELNNISFVGYNYKKITIEYFKENGGILFISEFAVIDKKRKIGLKSGFEFHQDNNSIDLSNIIFSNLNSTIAYKVNRYLMSISVFKLL